MTEIQRLLTTLKRQLRRRGLTYREVATALALSEPSVKRLFASGRFTLDRLAQVAELAGYTLAELAQEAAATQPRLRCLSEAQERELTSDSRLLLVAICALNHWGFEEILATYRLSEAECIQRLVRLDRLGLIELLPGNRMRLLVARDFDWLPDGPIHRFFRAQGEREFLGAPFLGEGELLQFNQGMLTTAGIAEMQRELQRLRRRFAELHDEAVSAGLKSRRGIGLLLAMRGWEPAEFAALRRD